MQAEDFDFALSLFSLVAAGIMVCSLVCYTKNARQVRPRIMLVLASLDFVASLLFAVGSLPIQLPSGHAWLNFFLAAQILGQIFAWTSFTWTCIIAHHIYIVISTGMEPDGEEERQIYTRYCLFTFALMGCIFAPLCLLFVFYKPLVILGGDEQKYTENLIFAFTAIQFVFVAATAIRIHVTDSKTAQAGKYRQQIRRFLFAYLFLMSQLVISLLVGVASPGYLIDQNTAWKFYISQVIKGNLQTTKRCGYTQYCW
jgi:hypothetical protein